MRRNKGVMVLMDGRILFHKRSYSSGGQNLVKPVAGNDCKFVCGSYFVDGYAWVNDNSIKLRITHNSTNKSFQDINFRLACDVWEMVDQRMQTHIYLTSKN